MNEATTTYDIYREYRGKSPIWVAAVRGIQNAGDCMAKTYAEDPSSDYFLYCSVTGRTHIRLRKYTKLHPGALPSQPSRDKAR